MPLENLSDVTAESLGSGRPRAARPGEQMYLVETPNGGSTFVAGVELMKLPPPVRVAAIAWRV